MARISEVEDRDFFGFERNDLIGTLPFENAKQFLKDGVASESWKPTSRSRESVLAEMLDYMPFAWEKANGGRGISASRSMSHYSAWVWLAGDDLGDLTEYQYYGKDNLRRICEHYGWDADKWDDGIRVN